MTPLNIPSSGSPRDALETNSIVFVLKKYNKHRKLSNDDKEILSRGYCLVNKMIEGAALIEMDTINPNLSPTDEGLNSYGYALSSIENLKIIDGTFNKLSKQEGIHPFLTELSNKIKRTEENKYNKTDLSILIKFFTSLRDSFLGDIEKDLYEQPEREYAF